MRAAESLVDAPVDRSGPTLADWAEAAMLAEGRDEISRADLRSRLQSSYPEDEDADGSTYDEVKADLDLLFGEVDTRRKLAPDVYPFDTDRQNRIWVDHRVAVTPYEFLLWLCVSEPFRAERRFAEVDTLFETTSCCTRRWS
jgi:hypothetical protein